MENKAKVIKTDIITESEIANTFDFISFVRTDVKDHSHYDILYYLIFVTKDYNLIKQYILSIQNERVYNRNNSHILYKVMENYFQELKNHQEYDGFSESVHYWHSIVTLIIKYIRPTNKQIDCCFTQLLPLLPRHLQYDVLINIQTMAQEHKYQTLTTNVQYGLEDYLSEQGQDKNDRFDLSHEIAVIIDCDKTKKADDALSAIYLPNGNYLLMIHIVDVVGSALINDDIESIFDKGLKDSFGSTKSRDSLMAGKTKKVLSHLYEIDPSGNIVNDQVVAAYINPLVMLDNKKTIDLLKESYDNEATDTLSILSAITTVTAQIVNYTTLHDKNQMGDWIVHIAMVLESYKIAHLAEIEGFPFLFKNQEVIDYKQLCAHIKDMQYSIHRFIKPETEVSFSTESRGYFKRQLAYYSRATAPLIESESRINQALIWSFLLDNKYPDEQKLNYWTKFLKNRRIQIDFERRKMLAKKINL